MVFSLLLLAFESLVEIGNWRSSAPSIPSTFPCSVQTCPLQTKQPRVFILKTGEKPLETPVRIRFKTRHSGNYPVCQLQESFWVPINVFELRNLWTLRIFRCLLFRWPSGVRLFVTPWTAALQAPLFLTISQSLPGFMSIELVMSSNHLILCHPLLLLPSVFPCIRVFSSESAIHIRWLKYESLHIHRNGI